MDGRQAKPGDKVSVHYAGKLANGAQFDSSSERGPIEVQIGTGQLIKGIDNALVDMTAGDTKSVTVEPDEGYGAHKPELVHVVERQRLPAKIDLRVGTQLQATDPQGNQLRLNVVEIGDNKVTLDANHPLAGKSLVFEIKLVEFAD